MTNPPIQDTLLAVRDRLEAAKWGNEHGSTTSSISNKLDIALNLLDTAIEQAKAMEPATCPYIVTGSEGTSYCRLAEQNGALARQEMGEDEAVGFISSLIHKRLPLAGIPTGLINNLANEIAAHIIKKGK